jgi:hypothetical protein
MASDVVGGGSHRPLLTLGWVDRLRVQVGHRAAPDRPPYQQFLLDLPVPEPDGIQQAFAGSRVLALLEPVLYVGAEAPAHYSLHEHRWHTSWGPSPGALEIGLLVTTGTRAADVSEAAYDGVTRAFRDLMEAAALPVPSQTSREAAIARARDSAATAYALDAGALSLSSEEHHPTGNSWTVGLRASPGNEYEVVVGFIDGFAGAVRVRPERFEVSDSVGLE